MIYIHLITKKPCSYCPESLFIYSFYVFLEQETSTALVTRYRCQSYKLFKINRLQKLPGGLIAGVARRVRSQKIKPPRKNLEIIRFFKRREILVISLVAKAKILKQNSFMHSTEHLLQFRLGGAAFSCKNWRCK